jgi:SagB-type dehydrogenase family enzyme
MATFKAARRRLEHQRVKAFQAFGREFAEAECPATLLYHRHSSLPLLAPGPTTEDVSTLTRTLDYKRYPGTRRVALTRSARANATLDHVIAARRSVRAFTREPITRHDVAAFLKLSTGLTAGGTPPYRAAPSAGALYCIETYVLAHRVVQLPASLYHYLPVSACLERVGRLPALRALWNTLAPGFRGVTPAMTMVLTARLPRVQAKYQERAYRFALLEAGHLMQNVLLTATALGLGAVPIGGFYDDELARLIGVDGREEVVVYAGLVGRPRE